MKYKILIEFTLEDNEDQPFYQTQGHATEVLRGILEGKGITTNFEIIENEKT